MAMQFAASGDQNCGVHGQQMRCRCVAQSFNGTPGRLFAPCSRFMKGAYGVEKWVMTNIRLTHLVHRIA